MWRHHNGMWLLDTGMAWVVKYQENKDYPNVYKGSLLLIESPSALTHWSRVTHICVSNIAIIGSDNGLSPGRRQAIIWTNAGILLIGPLGTNFNEILIKIYAFSFKKMHLKMSSGKRRPFCLGLNVLIWMKPMVHDLQRSCNDLFKTWHQVNSPSNGYQGGMPYW